MFAMLAVRSYITVADDNHAIFPSEEKALQGVDVIRFLRAVPYGRCHNAENHVEIYNAVCPCSSPQLN